MEKTITKEINKKENWNSSSFGRWYGSWCGSLWKVVLMKGRKWWWKWLTFVNWFGRCFLGWCSDNGERVREKEDDGGVDRDAVFFISGEESESTVKFLFLIFVSSFAQWCCRSCEDGEVIPVQFVRCTLWLVLSVSLYCILLCVDWWFNLACYENECWKASNYSLMYWWKTQELRLNKILLNIISRYSDYPTDQREQPLDKYLQLGNKF